MSEKVARPETPNLDLVEDLSLKYYYPVGARKLASAGYAASTDEQLVRMMRIGSQVADAVEARPGHQTDPLATHEAKVASALGYQPDYNAQVRQLIADDEQLQTKFAAALGEE